MAVTLCKTPAEVASIADPKSVWHDAPRNVWHVRTGGDIEQPVTENPSQGCKGAALVLLSDYCRCDGVSDDTAGFASAMAATPVGGELYLGPAGTTVLVRTAAGFNDRSIDLDDWNDRRMFGEATIKLADDVPSGRTLMRGHLHRSRFEGFTLDGNVAARAPGAYGPEGEGFNPKDSSFLSVVGVTVIRTHQDGFDFDDCSDCHLYKCRAIDCWGDGYHMGGTVGTLNNRVVIEQCTSENCGHVRRTFDVFGAGFSCGGKNNKLIDCVSKNDQRGVFWFSADSQLTGNMIIDAGTDAAASDIGIMLHSGSYGCVVSNNSVLQTASITGSVGIKVFDERNIVDGNFLKNVRTGVEISNKRNRISNNLVSGATHGAYVLSDASGVNVISGNAFVSCSYGVRSDGASARCTGNTVDSCSEQGFDIRASSCIVSENDVTGGSKYGCRLFSGTVLNCVITNNRFSVTSGGVSVAGTGHVIAANIVNGAMVP